MLMVQQALHQRRIADAVGIYRSARDLWPADGIFGTNDMAPEDEFLELRAVYFVDLKEVILIFSHLASFFYCFNFSHFMLTDFYYWEFLKVKAEKRCLKYASILVVPKSECQELNCWISLLFILSYFTSPNLKFALMIK